MNKFYSLLEEELLSFVQRGHDVETSLELSSISCLTTNSHDQCSLAVEQMDIFIDFLSSYILDRTIESESIVSIVAHSFDLTNLLLDYQDLFIELAFDDYLYLDEHFQIIYDKLLRILDHLDQLSALNSEIYHLEKTLLSYLPSIYLKSNSFSFSQRLASTLIEQTSRLLYSSSNLSTSDDIETIIPSSCLFSNSTNDEIHFSQTETSDYKQSLLQLDKINIHTTISTHSTLMPTFQYDFTDLHSIESNLKNTDDWIKLERDFHLNSISVWSFKELKRQTINPWSSETLWKLFQHFACADGDASNEFFLLIQWCFSRLTIEALNRDWDLFYSQTLINEMMPNRWRIVTLPDRNHLSCVGDSLNQMFLRLIQITTVFNQMKILSNQSTFFESYFSTIISSMLQNLTQRITGTFRLLIIWFDQHADAFINSNSLERTLIICHNDQSLLAVMINKFLSELEELKLCPLTIRSVNQSSSTCQSICKEKMSKLYRRIEINTHNHFSTVLPATHVEWRTLNQTNSIMTVACDKLLKPILSQVECFKLDDRFDLYDRILSTFIDSWTKVVSERKYRFNDDLIEMFQNDFEYLKIFLSTLINDQGVLKQLQESSSFQQVFAIIYFLRTGDQHSSSSLAHSEKWLHSRKSTSPLVDFFRNAFCCQRRNRVTTGP